MAFDFSEVLGIVGGGVTFRFSNGDAIPVENMPFFVRLYALVVLLKTLTRFSDYNGQNHIGFLKKSVAFGVSPAYS